MTAADERRDVRKPRAWIWPGCSSAAHPADQPGPWGQAHLDPVLRLPRRLRELGENRNEDLLETLALDAADTFTQDELDFAQVRFPPAQQADFDALGRLPQTL
ncbi:hypothetical protein [Streptomyces sp. S.PB5]|uniref:hypothetical protein n=1 Tax=Streptomyces sp. S.PB5 TaxID=3020844 RepID=UPI0025AFE44E|nr:hypothetical protein [Streptomyces sp. S.PB5]MDN3028054.1 hypothetical protein [Streptomyces sp. S.PB5]